jgi:hypothetical protein
MVACCGLLSLIFPQLFVWHFYCAVLRISTALCVTMTAFILPSIWSQFKFNLLLQIFDGLFTYHVLTQGIPEANPLVSSAIAEWGAVWGIVYWKLFACALLAMIFALRRWRQALAMKALILTSTVYGSLFFISLYYLLREFCA